MKIAIISDTHDNVPNIDEMLKVIKEDNVETIIHCGDVGAPSVLLYLAEKFPGQIYLSKGNVDGDHAKKLGEKETKNVVFYDNIGEVELNHKKIAFVHYPKKAKELAETNKYDYIFYGHSHEPWEETIGKTKIVNPGTLAGLFAKPTFAIYDTTTDELKLKVLYS